MQRSTGRLIGFCLLALIEVLMLTLPTTNSIAECHGQGPEIILDCLSAAYDNLNIEEYESLLAEDFRVEYSDMDTSWGLEGELKAVRSSFENFRAGSISISFNDDFTITEGSSPDTWEFTNLAATLEFDKDGPGEEQPVIGQVQNFTMIVMKVADPHPHYVIYRMLMKSGPMKSE
ncbi:MAG: hypothetical protein KJ927_11815 [Candidatus Eisenbacteria bacterium]|nr:hypothetical protein [Candidatus Eisenbacteria bacterium]